MKCPSCGSQVSQPEFTTNLRVEPVMAVPSREIVPDLRLTGKSRVKTWVRGLRAPVKYTLAAVAAVLAGGAAGIGLMSVLYGTLTAQSIVFTSQPASPVVGATYQVTARGGGSGNPVTAGIDPVSTAVCSISATATVTFNQPGTCIIDASQAGNSRYSAAPPVRQTITVGQ